MLPDATRSKIRMKFEQNPLDALVDIWMNLPLDVLPRSSTSVLLLTLLLPQNRHG